MYSNKKRIIVNWIDYLVYIEKLINYIKKSKIKFDYVYGISRGGLIPAVIISHKLNIKLIDQNLLNNYTYNKKLLIVDDIADTGKTIFNYLNNNIKKYKIVKTATIYKHINSSIIPDFYVNTTEKWIQFPYERN